MPDWVDTPSLLADIEARQNDVLRRLDELDRDILGLLSQCGSPRSATAFDGAAETPSDR